MLRRAATGLWVAICGACALAAGDTGSRPDAAAAQTLAESACAAYPSPLPDGTDLQAQQELLNRLQLQQDPQTLAIACRAWRLASRQSGAGSAQAISWLGSLGGSLIWLRQPEPGRTLIEHSYWQLSALGPGSAGDAAMAAGFVAAVAMQRMQYTDALAWMERAVTAEEHNPDPVLTPDRLRIPLNLAVVLAELRRLDDAEARLRKVLHTAEADLDRFAFEAALALNQLAAVARTRGDYAVALAHNERMLSLSGRIQDAQGVTLRFTGIGNRGALLMLAGRFDEAEVVLREGIAAADAAAAAGAPDLFGHQSTIRERLATLELDRGKIAQALATAADALAHIESSPEAATPRLARPLRYLADAQAAAGELAAAAASYRRGLDALGSARTEADTAFALSLGYAQLMLQLGDLEQAQDALARGDADLRARTPQERARRFQLEAMLAQRLGADAQALAQWALADGALAEAVPASQPQRRMIQAQRCEIDVEQCAPLSNGPNSPDEVPAARAAVHMALARRALASGNISDAERQSRAAISGALASGQPHWVWQAYARHAHVLDGAARPTEAIFFGKLALRTLGLQRAAVLPMGATTDARWLADKVGLFRQVADWLLREGRVNEALEVMSLLKRQEQSEFGERGAPAQAKPDVSMTVAEQRLLEQFEASSDAEWAEAAQIEGLRRLGAINRITSGEQATLDEMILAQAKRRATRQAALDAAFDQLQRQAAPAAVPAGDGRRLGSTRVPPGALRVWLLAGRQHLGLVMTHSRGTTVLRLPLPAAQLARRVATLRDAIGHASTQADGSLPTQLRALYDDIGQPIDNMAARARAQRVELWLDGPLRYLPLGLLFDGRHHLAEKYALTVSAAAAPGTPLDQPPPAVTPRSHLAAFGVTQALQGLPALPSVADELCGIVDGPITGFAGGLGCEPTQRARPGMPGSGRLDTEFTEAALMNWRDAAGGPRTSAPRRPGAAPSVRALLHISSHFVLRPGRIGQSWLLLGDGSRLSLDRLRGLSLSSPQMVTLSACDSAASESRTDGGREVDGMALAWLDSGAGQVLASLWRVDDRATAHFMRRFYAELARRPADAAIALQRTQVAALREGWPARHWAAFTLTVADRH